MNSIPRGLPARVLPQTVTLQTQNRSDGDLTFGGHGSGVFINNTGLVLTCDHVVRDSSGGLTVTLSNGTTYPAQVVAKSKDTDLALVQLTTLPEGPTPAATFAPVESLRVGDPVFAVGAPFTAGLSESVTVGHISHTARYGSAQSDCMMPVVQHTAAASCGNSGGPLYNAKGWLVGINSYIRGVRVGDDTGINAGYAFALRTDAVARVVSLLQQGMVPRRLSFGASLARMGPLTAKALGAPNGLVVRDVNEKSVASIMGLQADDVITAINGKPMTTPYQMVAELMLSQNGSISVTVWRQGVAIEHVENIPGLKRRTGFRKRKGFSAFGLQLETRKGRVTVRAVEPGSPASGEGYSGGETISHIKSGTDWVAVTCVTQLNKVAKGNFALVRVDGMEGNVTTVYKAK